MEVKAFKIDEHLEIISAWLKRREHPAMTREDLPALGVIIYDGSLPVSAGFVSRTETGFGIFDGLVSNPDAPAHSRDKANDLVISSLIEKARELNFKGILAFTRDAYTLMRAIRHGFEKQDQIMLTLSLNS